jgi:prepilin-type N-terminal cleavage/methylation domain-containing protein
MRREDNKGFTLAELLIVVAIIGVLVAISIPIFCKQLEKARDATTLANLRNVYAEVQTEYISQAGSTQRKNYWVNGGRHIFVTYQSDGRVIIDAFVQIESKKDATSMRNFIANSSLAFKSILTVNTAVSPGIYELNFTYNSDGTLATIALKGVSSAFKNLDTPISAS